MNTAARRGARWIVLPLPLLLAVVFSTSFSAPFSPPKNAIFVLAAFALTALTLFFSSRLQPQSGELFLSLAVISYVAVTVVSALVSPWRYLSLQSITFSVCGVLLFWTSRTALGSDDRVRNTRNFLISATAAAVTVSMIAVAQYFHLDPLTALGAGSTAAGRMRIYGTLGNPNFVAAFLAGAVPAALALIRYMPQLRGLWIAASGLIGVAIVLTGSRAGAIALAVGVLVIALTMIRRRDLRAWVVVAVALVCLLAASARLNPRQASESLRGRVFIWQVSLSEGAAHSALGSGPGTFAYLYPARLGQYFKIGRETLLHFAGHERHAQNDFVETLHDTGWVGLGSFAAIMLSWFLVAIKRFKTTLKPDAGKSGTADICLASIAAVSALCVAAFFDFPLHRAETWALLWLWMAVPLADQTPSPAPTRKMVWLRYVVALLLLSVGSYSAFSPLAASYRVAKGETEERRGHLDTALAAYRSALRWDTSSPDANFDLTRVLAKSGDYAGAIAQAQVATRYVNEPELYILCSRILQNAGRHGQALHVLETGIRLFPYSIELREEVASLSAPVKESD